MSCFFFSPGVFDTQSSSSLQLSSIGVPVVARLTGLTGPREIHLSLFSVDRSVAELVFCPISGSFLSILVLLLLHRFLHIFSGVVGFFVTPAIPVLVPPTSTRPFFSYPCQERLPYRLPKTFSSSAAPSPVICPLVLLSSSLSPRRGQGVRDSVRPGHAQDLQLHRPGPSWLGTNDADVRHV